MEKEEIKVAILGGGYAGLQAAIELDKKGFSPILIDKNSYHDLLPEIPHIISERSLKTKVPFSELFNKKNIQFVQDEIVRINYQNKSVELKNKQHINFDYLVIALGSQTNFFNIPGLQENSMTFHSTDKVIKFLDHIKACFAKAKNIEKSSEEYASLLSIVVGGGGLTGVEVAGELIHELPIIAEEIGINPGDVKLHLIEANKNLLTVLDKDISDKVTNFYKSQESLDLILGCPIKEAFPDKVELANGRVIPTKTILWTGGIRANAFVDKPFLDENGNEAKFPCGRGFRLEVDEYYRIKDIPNTYAIGDNAMVMDPESNQPVPQNGQAAYKQGKNVAYHIIADMNKKTIKPGEIVLDGLMVSLGPKKGTGMIINPFTFYLPVSLSSRIFKKAIELRYKLLDIRR